jgi:hypothetical protein
VLAVISDVAIFVDPPGKTILVYKVDGSFVRQIRLNQPDRSIVISCCGRLVAVRTTLGVYLYDTRTTGWFDAGPGDTYIASSKINEMDNTFDDRGVANCMAFS